jgi:tetratricopeptide (TPR) repeat protein
MNAATALLLLQAVVSPIELQLPAHIADRPLADTPHSYAITMHRGQALIGVVQQKGIDAVIVLRDSWGAVVFEVDSPNGSHGPEPIALIAPADGRFALEVRPFGAATAGAYDLILEPLRKATARDRGLVDGLGLYLGAFRDRGTALRLQSEGEFARSHALYRSARRDARRSLALRKRWLGADALESVAAHQLLGLIDDETGEYRSGERHFERALSILEARLGADHPGTMNTRSDLGYLRSAAGHYRDAIALFDAVLAAGERTGVPEAALANTLTGLGETLLRSMDFERAVSVLRRAVRIRETTVGLDHPTAHGATSLLGLVLVRRGAAAEGEAICARLDAVLQAGHGSSGHRATPNACLAEAAMLRGDFGAAVSRATSFVGLREASYGPDGPPTAEALTLLGRAQAAAGQKREAKSTLRRAYTVQKRRLGDAHPSTVATARALQTIS